MKKLSELMLEGYAMVGRQCKRFPYMGISTQPRAVCALGAARLAAYGSANQPLRGSEVIQACAFASRVGIGIADLNDEGMSIPDIAGIAAAEGL